MLRNCVVVLTALGWLACRDAEAENIQFNTDTGVMTIDGTATSSFFGVPVDSSVIDGVMQFRFRGDMVFIPGDTVGAAGVRPLSLFAGNDVRINSGAVLNFDIAGRTGKLGGGNGGASVSGGGVGTGGNGGLFGVGGAGGTGSVPFGDLSIPGATGGAGSPGSAGSVGSAGSAGQLGGAGFNNATGVRAAGGAGSAGQPGAPAAASTGGTGGPRGTNSSQGNGEDGGTGIVGGQGPAGGNAPNGGSGGNGLSGLNNITGLVLSGGAGGSSGGSGGGGGGGAGGTGGAGGGGGGGGGVGVIIFVGESGGAGGLGGFGGSGAKGGNGSQGATSGPGGGGGAAVEIAAQGRINLAGTISVRGGIAFARGLPASPQSGGTGSDGLPGFLGASSATGLGGDGGTGGPGGKGGAGGTGGRGGDGGYGGGGAGGTVLFKSTFLHAAGGTIDASGGISDGNAGGNGRYVTSDNGGVAPNFGTPIGAQREEFVGQAARDLNKFISGGSTTTSNLVDLAGGADVYGIKQGILASNEYFQQVRAGAPVNALAAVVRRTEGPSEFDSSLPGVREQYASHDLLMVVNLTNGALPLPKLGVGPTGSNFLTRLAERGFSKNPLFGGTGATSLQNLAAGQVFATLVNGGDNALQVNASLAGNALEPISFGNLNVSYIVKQNTLGDFSNNGLLDAPDLPAMLKALTNLPAFQSQRGLSDRALVAMADLNGDNFVTNSDIQPLINMLAAAGLGSVTAVPEPTSFSLAAFCFLAMGLIQKASRRAIQTT